MSIENVRYGKQNRMYVLHGGKLLHEKPEGAELSLTIGEELIGCRELMIDTINTIIGGVDIVCKDENNNKYTVRVTNADSYDGMFLRPNNN